MRTYRLGSFSPVGAGPASGPQAGPLPVRLGLTELLLRVVEVRELGGALLHMGLAGIIQNFDPQDPDDVAQLEAFFALEDRLWPKASSVLIL